MRFPGSLVSLAAVVMGLGFVSCTNVHTVHTRDFDPGKYEWLVLHRGEENLHADFYNDAESLLIGAGYRLVKRDLIDLVLREHKIQISRITKEQAVKLGQLTNATGLMKIDGIGLTRTASLIDLESAEPVWKATAEVGFFSSLNVDVDLFLRDWPEYPRGVPDQ